jgi:glycosyltransferase involved in cell wall biosynthesis
MDVLLVVEHPTQFDVPFFRWVAEHGGGLNVLYLRVERFDREFFDPELARSVSWQQDLATGYPSVALSKRNRARGLIREVLRRRYALVIVAGYRSPLLLMAALAARLRGSLVALRLDTVAFGNQSTAKRRLKRLLYIGLRRVFHRFLGVGEATQSFLLGVGVPPDRIGRFPYSIDVDRFQQRSTLGSGERRRLRRRYGLADSATIVLSVTKFSDREAPWDLLRAAARGGLENVQLWLVGEGPERGSLEDYAAHAGCDAVFSGYVRYSALPEVYGAADIYVHPVHFEPWGVSLQEAMACGLPVVASSQVGSAYDLITHGTNGYIYEVGDSGDLRSKLEKLRDEVDLATVRAEHARRLSPLTYEATWASLQAVARGR